MLSSHESLPRLRLCGGAVSQSIPPSKTFEMQNLLKAEADAGNSTVDLSVGDVLVGETPPEVIEALAAGAKDSRVLGYTPGCGHLNLRGEAAEMYARRMGVPILAGNVAFVAGGKQGYFNVLAALLDGSSRLGATAPGWCTTFDAVIGLQRITNGNVLPPSIIQTGPSDEYFFSPDTIREAHERDKVNVFVLVIPGNPTAVLPSRKRIAAVFEALARLASEHPAISVIIDNPYSSVIVSDRQPLEWYHFEHARQLFNAGRLIEIRSYSKRFRMAGWRAATVLGPEDLIKHIGLLRSTIDGNLCGPLQVALHKAIEIEQSIPVAAGLLDIVRRNIGIWKEALAKSKVFRLEVEPDSLYLWVHHDAHGRRTALGTIKNDDDLARQMVKLVGLGVVASHDCFVTGGSAFRVSMAAPSGVVQQGAERLLEFEAMLEGGD